MSDRRANHLGSQRQHVHIIVFHTLMRRVNIVTERGPDSRHLIGGYGNPHPATADEDATRSLSHKNCVSNRLRIIRKIHGIGAMRTQVEDLVTQALEVGRDIAFQRKTSVV